ncbi:MAG: hypothetical protein KAT77_06455 [Nanoarchaeota archaeon]|nr:hypothetical protein [Nanoarchaeota archaeon]
MERLNDPVFAFFEDNPEIVDILFRNSNGKDWKVKTDNLDKAANIFLEDIFQCNTLPYIQNIIFGQLYSVHYHREESKKPIRTLIGSP